jgi:hypothetical protein
MRTQPSTLRALLFCPVIYETTSIEVYPIGFARRNQQDDALILVIVISLSRVPDKLSQKETVENHAESN